MRDKIRSANKTNATIIYNYTHGVQFSSLVKSMSYSDIKRYLKQLLIALDVSHSNGVIHRDVKLSNTIVNTDDNRLQLIDWGLGEFYIPQQRLNPRAGTRFYKAPELLLEYPYFDYSIDMWSFGLVVAQIVFHKKPLFHGTNSTEQLVHIAKQLGTADLYAYAEKYGIVVKESVRKALKSHAKKEWVRYCRKKHHCSEESLDLIGKLLVYDHKERMTAKEAMEHAFFR